MPPRYPILWNLLFRLVIDGFADRRRSFGPDARACVAKLKPPLLVYGEEHIPACGLCLVTFNHYSRPGFQAWWLALAISAVLPYEVLWTVTAAWTFPDRLRARWLTPLTRHLFQRVADVYGFISMPPMPPDPGEVMERARSVRRVLSYIQKADHLVIGLAPEGRDFEGGRLGSPPVGAGRFMLHLSDLGMQILPLGAYEADGRFCIRIGPAYQLEVPVGLPNMERDRCASRIVMSHIACLLPIYLRGQYSSEINSA